MHLAIGTFDDGDQGSDVVHRRQLAVGYLVDGPPHERLGGAPPDNLCPDVLRVAEHPGIGQYGNTWGEM